MPFSAHGQLEAYYDEDYRTLHVSITTPVNKEFVAEYESTLGPIRAAITAPHWVSIITLNGDPLTPLDSFPITKETMKNAVSKGLCASAMIFNVESGKLAYQEFWEQLYEGSGLVHQYFDDENSAQAWLSGLLEQCDRDTG